MDSLPSRQPLIARRLLIPALLTLAAVAMAQGTRADYERARQLPRLLRDKVRQLRLQPHWVGAGAFLWYRREQPRGRCSYVLIDSESGRRAPAFDHAGLATALSEALGRKLEAERMPLEKLTFSEDASRMTFRCARRWWSAEAATGEVEEATAPEESALKPKAEPRPSSRTGPETSITFVNRSARAVLIHWIDGDGQRRSYGRLPAGERREQHTYAGHVWLVTRPGGQRLGVFEATEQGGEAMIEEARGRRPAQRPREPAARDRSPDRRWRALIKDHDVYVCDLESGQEIALTEDGSAEDAYGGRMFWSPDARRLVVLRTQAGEDREVHLVESAPKDQLQPKLHHFSYRKPGDRIPHPKPQLFDVATRERIPIDDTLFPNPWNITRLRWAPDSSHLTFLYNQRGHQVLRLVAVDGATGSARALIDEQSSTFIDYAGKLFVRQLDATGEIIWMSERDGWNHLYLFDAVTGELKNPITRGSWVVRGVDHVDPDRRQIWFRAGGIRPGQDPYHVHFCRVDFDGSDLVILTEGDGTHAVTLSPDRRCFIDTWSRVDLPPVHELRSAQDGHLIAELERADASALIAAGWRPPERFAAKGRDDRSDIWGVIFRPTTFDAVESYPVIEQIYAGPHGAFVPKTFRPFHRPQALAELGFVVVQIDGMGTSQRSKAFHDVCWKNLGDSGFPDRIRWMQAAAAKDPSLDLERVGIYGGSAGGQSALRALLAHGEFYRAAAADCGCHDNRMDKIWWNELWMGWPIGPHYAEQSNVTQAHNLRGKLLLTVGELDRNVDPASTMQVVKALIAADKDFELLVVPGAGHGVGETPYARRRRQDFFVRHLLGVEPRGP